MLAISFLGRPYLYVLDVNIYGHSNFYLFVYKGKKVKLVPMRHAPSPNIKPPDVPSNKKALNLKSLDKEIAKGSTIIILVVQKLLMTPKNGLLLQQSQY